MIPKRLLCYSAALMLITMQASAEERHPFEIKNLTGHDVTVTLFDHCEEGDETAPPTPLMGGMTIPSNSGLYVSDLAEAFGPQPTCVVLSGK